MTGNLAIWGALAKTDPKHTKQFSRSGGFKGTAIKPIWIVKMLTEQFGPCGVGWGMNEPSFQVVPCEGEILVFCTVSGWQGDRANVLWGVGGDKVQSLRSGKPFCDDEAFKKAFTDAVNNAFKFLGVGADVHMGLFDDDKYVSQAREEFAEPAPPPDTITDDQRDVIAGLSEAAGVTIQTICESYNISDLRELPSAKFEAVKKRLNLTIQDKKPTGAQQKEAA